MTKFNLRDSFHDFLQEAGGDKSAPPHVSYGGDVHGGTDGSCGMHNTHRRATQPTGPQILFGDAALGIVVVAVQLVYYVV